MGKSRRGSLIFDRQNFQSFVQTPRNAKAVTNHTLHYNHGSPDKELLLHSTQADRMQVIILYPSVTGL